MFYAYGFDKAKICGAKMVTTFKLCSEQLSSQCHYDYGMRAVKTVIVAAGNLKRVDPDLDEEILLLRALQDVNLPKFLAHDLPLFDGIIKDIFPGKKRPTIDYGSLFSVLKGCAIKLGLQPIPFFMTKCIQLYEMIVIRHGLMLVGPTGGGKTKCNTVLAAALEELKIRGDTGHGYEKVKRLQMNPKSVTLGQLYGQFDPNTHEWQDGILAILYREAASCTKPDLKWVVFNGPVDAIWIENMNTVLDDNKKLCLNSGEMIFMSSQMTMMFEVEDLLVASPATVSRVGIIYMEPHSLGLDCLTQSWLERLPESINAVVRRSLCLFFDRYVATSISFIRTHVKELCPSVDNNLIESLTKMLDCFLDKFAPKEGVDPPSETDFKNLEKDIEMYFMFSLIWSIGGTCDTEGRIRFDAFLRAEMCTNCMAVPFPPKGQIYDYSFSPETHKWVAWLDTIPEFVLNPKLSFAEIVVPTTDSIRNTYLLDLLLKQKKHVLMIGETGTGKTVNVARFLQELPQDRIPLTTAFSAQTTANQIQDFLDSKMEKRRKGVFGPSAGKQFIVYVDDLNMPKKETYGAQPPIELLRQWFDQSGWYDRKALVFRRIIDTSFVSSMGPPGGGRNPITPRFLRHFIMIGYAQISDESKQVIFSAILNSFVQSFPPAVQGMSNAMVKSTILVYNRVTAELLPTPAKTHYMFNLRDLAKVVQGVLMGSPKVIDTPEKFVRLWVHEAQRVFQDRMTNDTDRTWFKELLKDMTENEFVLDWNTIYNQERLFFGDYMIPGADPKVYAEVEDIAKLQPIIEEYLLDHNAESKSPMPLVMFLDAIEHVSRISRVIRQPQGNALLLGVGGSGRQSLSRLATFIAGYKLFQVEIVKGYGVAEWREDVKNCLLDAGVNDKPVVFLFSDVQIVNELMLEDTNGILNAGDIPNLYGPEDMDAISQACRMDCQQKGIPATKLNIFGQYIIRVRNNIHVCLCMSPVGSQFRDRLRMFPSIVNCCTIDWFAEWPAQALNSVANAALEDPGLDLGDDKPKLVEMFKHLHQSVEQKSREYLEAMRRYNYVTPTSYLELLSTFKSVLSSKKEEVSTAQFRLQNGVNKITETKGLVDGMKDKLVELQPQLTKTQAEVDAMMVQITEDKKKAAVTKESVEKEEAAANIKAANTKEIADSAQRDLDEALPALAMAVECLNKLKKADLDEVKSLKTPPGGVKLTMEAACIMFGHKPTMRNDPDKIGKKIPDYWDTAQKTLLSDAKHFLASLFDYDKENIPDATIKKIEPYIAMEEFTPKAIEKASKACTAICMWVRAMFTYHNVALGVEPKKIALAAAQEELDVTLAALKDARERLKAVMDRLAELESNFNAATTKKEELAAKVVSVQVQLSNAEKLLGGLGGEEIRWKKSVGDMEAQMQNLRGDVLISAGTIAYLGAFTFEYRQVLCTSWRENLCALELKHTPNCDITTTLVEPVKLQQWQIASLPVDNVSTQNGIIMARGRRWPLCIDPQGQANRFVKNLGKNPEAAENGLEVVKMSDKNFLRALENGVRFGRWVLLENIGEDLDAALEPILLQQKFKESGQDMIKLGDNNVPYNNSFKFFITTKLPNPHYAPEVCVKVTLLNFTITMKGLEEQLLGVVVKEEMPELAERKAALIVENAECNKQLFDIESQILYMLAHSEGNILDDTVLIETLSQAKQTSKEVNEKKQEAEETSKEIDETSEGYRPVAFRAALLFFCIADLEIVDSMYSYSLQWFTTLFVKGVQMAEAAAKLETRLDNLKNFFTYSIYRNVCRSLFAAHKTLFSFLLAIKVLQGNNKIDAVEYRFILSGFGPTKVDVPNPDPTWIESHAWAEICFMSGLPAFKGFAENFYKNVGAWRTVFDSSDPPSAVFPDPWEKKLTIFQRITVIRCLRPDKLMQIIQKFVSHSLGQKFIEPPPFDLPGTFEDSINITPLIFILSPGSDPQKELMEFAVEMSMDSSLKSIALGQGQGKIAANMIETASAKGEWVMLQNCHLCVSWMPELERICEEFDVNKVHNNFRLWLTSLPTKAFPTSILQDGVKMTKEAPKGLRANLQNTYFTLNDEKVSKSNKPEVYQKLLFGLCFFHANACERKKFGPLGWNIPYAFNETDLDISMNQMELFLNEYDDTPYAVLNFLFSVINYGGRITDDKDIRTIAVILVDMMAATTLNDNHPFSRSGTYKSITPDKDNPHQSYVEYIDSLPLEPEPEVFGMHENANIACDQTEAFHNMDLILTLQPRVSSGGGLTRDEIVEDLAKSIQKDLFPLFDLEAIGMKYPTDYSESMNTTLVQEISRYNRLLLVMQVTLSDIQKGLKGLVVMSSELENMGTAMFNQKVPVIWESVAYPSLQPLTVWVKDLLKRLHFMKTWVDFGIPVVFWISGFYFPQGFMTGTLQNNARKHRIPIDTVSFSYILKEEAEEALTTKPEDGCYISGLYIEGARWNTDKQALDDPFPKELFSKMPAIHLLPVKDRPDADGGIYRCPVYKVLTRTGTLSTTGHSTNFISWIELPADRNTIWRPTLVSETNAMKKFCDQDYWIKAGVACFCALRY